MARIKQFLAFDRTAVDRQRGHQAHPRRCVRTENDWIAHRHAVTETRILDNGPTFRHNAGPYLYARRRRYALFGLMLYTDGGLVREEINVCVKEEEAYEKENHTVA